MPSSAFNLRYEQERWPRIALADVKDYQNAAA
jgi:peptide chain release factor 3